MDFYNSLTNEIPVAYDKDHRLEYGELSHEDLNKLCEHKCENVADIACGPAKTLIYFYLNSDAINIFGCEIDKARYDMGIENILKLREYLTEDTFYVQLTDHVILTSGRQTITFYHMSMYSDIVKQKVSEANIIIANIGYFYRNKNKYKEIFKNIQPDVKIISYKSPKFVDDQYIAHNV